MHMLIRPLPLNLELWAAARTDEALRQSLRTAERRARASRDRVLNQLFEPLAEPKQISLVGELTVKFI